MARSSGERGKAIAGKVPAYAAAIGIKTGYLLLLMWILSGQAFGDGLSSSGRGGMPKEVLTVAGAVQTALANNPGPAQAVQAVIEARHLFQQSLSALYPTLGLTGSAGMSHINYHKYDNATQKATRGMRDARTGLNLTYTLYDGFFKRFQSQIALSRLKSEQWHSQNTRRLLSEAVKLAFARVILSQIEINIFQEDLRFQESMLKESRLKRKADLVAEPHVLNFLIKRNQARQNLQDSEHTLRINQTMLARTMGLKNADFDTGFRLKSFPMDHLDDIPLLRVEACLKEALDHRQDLLALAAGREAAGHRVQSEKSRYAPTIFLQGSTRFEDEKTYYRHRRDSSSGLLEYEGLIRVSWDLYDAGSRKHGIAAACAELAGFKEQVDARRLEVAAEVRIAHENILKSQARHGIALENIRIQKRQRTLVTEQFRAGEVDLAYLNETQQELVALGRELAESGVSILSGMATLESSMGVVAPNSAVLGHRLWE